MVQKARRGTGSTEIDKVWMHPLLFIDFAMYINPRFKVQVLKFVQDQLITYRNQVADSWNGWTSTLKKLGANTQEDYNRIQRCMNYAVFGEHVDGIRNTATAEQLNTMRKYEEEICRLADFGMIKDIPGVRDYLHKIYDKEFPTPFSDYEILN